MSQVDDAQVRKALRKVKPLQVVMLQHQRRDLDLGGGRHCRDFADEPAMGMSCEDRPNLLPHPYRPCKDW